MESQEKVLKDTKSEMYCAMSSFLDFCAFNLESIVDIDKHKWEILNLIFPNQNKGT